MTGVSEDLSNGYDAVAREFIGLRSDSGVSVLRMWARGFSPGAAILDIGAGAGLPLTPALIAAGSSVSAIDASPKMIAAYRLNFPDHEVRCEAVEMSAFFGRRFDGILAVGLIFLLPEIVQQRLIARVSDHLSNKGRFLFSAPRETCEWTDSLTGLRSRSLGVTAYERCLEQAGLSLMGERMDESGNHYFDAHKI